MTCRREFPIEKLALALASGALLTSVVVFGGAAVAIPSPANAPHSPEPAVPVAAAPAAVAGRIPAWPRPGAQSAGPDWEYELFTPPTIVFNPAARAFGVLTPEAAEPGALAGQVELLAISREPYRLQLAGYFGGPENWLAAFTSPGRPEMVLARAGHRFEDLRITFRRFEIRKLVVAEAAGQPVYEVAGVAVVQDDATGTEIELDTRGRRYTEATRAVLRVGPDGSRPLEVGEGDTLVVGGFSLRIERIQFDPAEVVVARALPGLPVPETRILRLESARRLGPGDPAAPALAGRP